MSGYLLEQPKTGDVFSRLTVVSGPYRNNKRIHPFYICKCKCGNEIEVTANNLLSNNSKSCGCLRRMRTREKIQLMDYQEHQNIYHGREC